MNDELRQLLGKLAPHEPISQDEQGGCVWCGGGEPGVRYSYAERYLSDHDRDCPWVLARQALGDELPEQRAQAQKEQSK